ncbi:hypothetical protein A9Q86_11600 [Flavobacteriales bacterium 33_180_T64]|nr:hypothetical protein A9Q86_11600 [Flavobacteriales bacterium 33_180_T64]
MKNLLTNAIACAIVMTTCYSCSVESFQGEQSQNITISDTTIALDALDPCDSQDPQARITNSGTVAITLEIATIDGVILHTVHNLNPGNASSFLTFAADDIIFNISKNTTGIRDEKVVFMMNQCMSFDMEVGIDNYLIPSVPENL